MDSFWEIVLFTLALFRVVLEFLKFDLSALPLAKKFSQSGFDRQIRDFHRMGFYLGLGYVSLTLLQIFLKII